MSLYIIEWFSTKDNPTTWQRFETGTFYSVNNDLIRIKTSWVRFLACSWDFSLVENYFSVWVRIGYFCLSLSFVLIVFCAVFGGVLCSLLTTVNGRSSKCVNVPLLTYGALACEPLITVEVKRERNRLKWMNRRQEVSSLPEVSKFYVGNLQSSPDTPLNDQ